MAEQQQTQNGSDLGGKLVWFAAGAVIGAAIALLYAPQTGKETRKAISKTAERGKEMVTETTGDIIGAGRDIFDRGRRIVEDAADLFDRGRKLVRG